MDKLHAEALVRSCQSASSTQQGQKELADLSLRQSVLTSLPLLAADFITIWFLLLGTSWIIERTFGLSNQFVTRDTALVASLLLVPIAQLAGLYPALGTSSAVEFRQLVRAAGTALCIFSGIGIVAHPAYAVYFLIASLLTLLLAIPIMPAARFTTRCLAARASWWGAPVLIYERAELAEDLFRRLHTMRERGLKPAAVLLSTDDYWTQGLKLEELGVPACDVRNALQCALQHQAAWVLIGNDPKTIRTPEIDEELNAIPNRVVLSSGSFDCGMWDSTHTIGPVCGLRLSNPRHCGFQAFLKRTVDVTATLSIGALISPLLVVIAACIRLGSPGPIFYSQQRIGRGGRMFSAWKFRTMVQDADRVLQHYLETDLELRREWQETHKLKRDPRVNWIGRMLRATSLDELPQLWNILRGDMSLVGPRPIVNSPTYDAVYVDDYPHEYAAYISMRPGLTGLWQVTCRNNGVYEMRIYWDMYYIRNWSLWLDLYIILRTIRTVLLLEGAY